MPTVTLTRRWGQHKAGSKVEVPQSKADFLVGIGFAEGSFVYNEASVSPGTDGPDPIVSGDPTRRRPRVVRGNREGNLALPAAGSPPAPAYGRGVAAKLEEEPAGKHAAKDEEKPAGRRLTATRRAKA